MTFRRRASSLRLFGTFLALLIWSALQFWGGPTGCNYSKSYFRIGPDGKMIKASGPITADELAGNTSPTGEETGTGTGVETAPTTTGGDESITPPEDTEGTGTATGGTGNTPALEVAARKLSVYRRPDFSFVYVSIDRSTKKVELYLKSSAPDTTPKKLTGFDTTYESPLLPTISLDAQRVLFTNPLDSPALYQLSGLDQPTPTVSKWGDNPGYLVRYHPEEDKTVFIAAPGASLRSAKQDGSGGTDETSNEGGTCYGVSLSPVRDHSDPTYGRIVFGYDGDGNQPLKPVLAMKDPFSNDPQNPGTFFSLTGAHSLSETSPAISPDGKRIAYVRDGYLALCDLHDTKDWKAVCDNAFAIPGLTAENPCWTADGSRIVFSTKRDGNAEIYSVAATNAYELENLTNSPDTDDVQPACFPNPVVTMNKEIRLPANPPAQAFPVDSTQFDGIRK